MTRHADFDYARAHPEARQEFLDSALFDSIRHRVSGLVYEENLPADCRLPPNDAAFAYTLATLDVSVRPDVRASCTETRTSLPNIIVRASMFDNDLYAAGDVLSAILDHEMTHVEQLEDYDIVQGMGRVAGFMQQDKIRMPSTLDGRITAIMMRNAFQAAIERPAYDAQLKGAYAPFMSDKVVRITRANRDIYRDMITIIDQNARDAMHDLLTRPDVFYDKVLASPVAHGQFIQFIAMKQAEQDRNARNGDRA